MGESILSPRPNHWFASSRQQVPVIPPKSASASIGFYTTSDNNLALNDFNNPILLSGSSQFHLPDYQTRIVERVTW